MFARWEKGQNQHLVAGRTNPRRVGPSDHLLRSLKYKFNVWDITSWIEAGVNTK